MPLIGSDFISNGISYDIKEYKTNNNLFYNIKEDKMNR
jgi:hypothetical protein